MRLSPESINEAVGTVRSVFGDDWLKSACSREIGTALPFRMHPIGNFLMPPGEDQILHLLELVEYLKAAAHSPVFGELVTGLKSQYGPTFLQLAFGFRFGRAGGRNLEYEPLVQRGLKGDVAFTMGDQRLVAECYIPRTKRGVMDEANWLLHQCLELRSGVDERPCVLAIAIKLKTSPTSQQRKTIVRIVRESAREIDENVRAGRLHDDERLMETDAAYISVARTVAVKPGQNSLGRQHRQFPDMRGEQPNVFARLAVGTTPPPGELIPLEKETRDSVAIWFSDADQRAQSLDRDLDEPLADLTRKLERKLTQTKIDEHTGRVLVVSTWISRELHRASEEARRSLQRTLFEKHRGVKAVFLVLHTRLRTLAGVARPYYHIAPLFPGGVSTVEGLSALVSIETKQYVPPIG
jgi:hypothetical protein